MSLCTPLQPALGIRKRGVSDLSAEGDSRRVLRSSLAEEESQKRFRSISTSTVASSPVASSPSLESESFPSPPQTPTKTTFTIPSCSLPRATDELRCTIPLQLQYHNTASVCPEHGLVKYHKGIEPDHPKGYYCCLNVEEASRQKALRVIDNSVLMEVYGPRGLLAYLEASDSAIVRQQVQTLENLGFKAIISIEGFLEDRHCITASHTQRYKFTAASWNARVCIYSRPASDVSHNCCDTSASSPPTYYSSCESKFYGLDHVFKPSPVKKNLFGTYTFSQHNESKEDSPFSFYSVSVAQPLF